MKRWPMINQLALARVRGPSHALSNIRQYPSNQSPLTRGDYPDEASRPFILNTLAKKNVIFAVLALGAITSTLLQFMVIPSLPLIQREMHSTQASVTWVLTAFLLSSSVATPLLGKLGDEFGKKSMLVVALASLSLGGVLAGAATSVVQLIGAPSSNWNRERRVSTCPWDHSG
jgi:hypothetical protein